MKKGIFLAILLAGAAVFALSNTSFSISGDTATIMGGQSWNICVSTGTAYHGSKFSMDITKTDFIAQLTFGDFEGQQCKTIGLPAGTYTAKLNAPIYTGEISYTISGSTLTFSAGAAVKSLFATYGSVDVNKAATATTVTFNANSGTGSMTPQAVPLNTATALSTNTFTRAGYTFDGWNTQANGSGTSYADGASVTLSAPLELYAQWKQTLYDAVAIQVNDPYNIDFTKKAIVSDDQSIANGNGVNKYTENGSDVYYFRGQVDNNNVIWADICWKIVRTTATGGVKMIYNGEPTIVDTAKQCTATGTAAQINATTYKFNNNYSSPADVGYKYGARIAYASLSAGSTVFTFSNDVSKNGDTYTLDTSTGQSISGTWANERANAAARYHYFCTDGTSSCDNTKIGYIYYFGNSSLIYYLPVNGYTDIEAMKDAMFTNTTDSVAKSTIESWFETKNLDGHISGSRNYEDDLEDAVFCNDRSYYSGALKGKDSDATQESHYGAYGRNRVKTDNDYTPSLDCANSRDAFQVSNNNAKLNHKIGLATADELTLAGMNPTNTTNYLYTGQYAWSASPNRFDYSRAFVFHWGSYLDGGNVGSARGLRPLVSIKSGTFYDSGTGLATNPYIVP